LDDDMVADPRLVTEHDRSHHAGADAVMGRIPLHPDSPPGLLSDGVRAWADELATRLTRGGRIGHDDLVGGQLSVRRDVFDALGGFDTAYTAGGAYGGEDLDFGYRLQKAGYRIVFNPHAASYQRYVVDPATHLRQHRSAGAADVALVTRHPELAHDVFTGKRRASRIHQLIAPVVVTAPKLAAGFERLLTPIAVAMVARGRRDTLTRRLFVTARTIAYWQGVRAAGGPLDGRPEASESAGSTA
jgi:hypothetical protein